MSDEYIRKADAVEAIGEEYAPRTDFERGMVSQLSCDKAKIKALLSADVVPYSIDPDGTLTITVPKGMRVGRVLVQEEGTKFGGLFYAE